MAESNKEQLYLRNNNSMDGGIDGITSVLGGVIFLIQIDIIK